MILMKWSAVHIYSNSIIS